MMAGKRILSVGAPLIDLLAQVDDSFLQKVGGAKGGMEHCTSEELQSYLQECGKYETVTGGAAGNTVFMLARLGQQCAMLGMTGRDKFGQIYRNTFAKYGGSTEYLFESDTPNGACLALITPDSERTMRSCLSAALEINSSMVEAVDFSKFDVVYIECYAIFNQEYFEAVIRAAKAAGCEVAIDLGSFEIVGMFRERMKALVEEDAEIILANEDEARALFGDLPAEEMLGRLAEHAKVAVLKLGKNGSMICSGNEVYRIEAPIVEAIDTTAAGDIWAAGFFYGYLNDRPLDECGKYGSLLAAEVVQIIGSQIPEQRLDALRGKLEF